MFNNLTHSAPTNSLSLCSLDFALRNRSSVYDVVTLSSIVIISILWPVAVAGNSLVMTAIWRDASLRTPSYLLLSCLAFIDFCTGLITQPAHVAVRVICFNEVRGDKTQQSFLLHTRLLGECSGAYFSLLTAFLITVMSIERWLHMARRSLLTIRRSCFIVAVGTLLLFPAAVFRFLNIFKRIHGVASNITFFTLLLSCLLTTPIAYFKVFRIINRHQKQIQASGSQLNFGSSAFNLAKFKKSVFSILYVLGVFYLSFFTISGLYWTFNYMHILRVSRPGIPNFADLSVFVFFGQSCYLLSENKHHSCWSETTVKETFLQPKLRKKILTIKIRFLTFS